LPPALTRGITTVYTYDELNRVTQKTYSDTTPSVSYYYDYAPPGSPISVLNPLGRLTRVSTTTSSGVTATSYYSYCSCSSVDQEATVITDGITKTYITSYTHDYLGGITSMTYPNGKVVAYTRDNVGRETKVSTTVGSQNVDIVRSASYLGPAGQLDQVTYGIGTGNEYAISYLASTYTYSAKTGRLTSYQTYGLRETLNYGMPGNPSIQTGQIFDITDEYNPQYNRHYDYDRWGRLASFWIAPGRNDAFTRKLTWTYDQYNNMTSMLSEPIDPNNCPPTGCVTQYYVDTATNRLTYLTGPNPSWAVSYSYDSAGNNTGAGRTFDAENRLKGMWGESYLYDGNSHRLRVKYGSIKTYYVYSATGLLLLDDNWTDGTIRNQIYFNGQLVATHDQADYVRFVFKDYLGTIRNMAEVTPGGGNWALNWSGSIEWTAQILPYGFHFVNWWTLPATPNKYTDKPLDSTGLSYFGARYYDGGAEGPSLRWISPDPITARVYDPESLNKYSYVRNDPVNLIDPDGKEWISITGTYQVEWWSGDPRQYAPEILDYGTFEINIWIPTPHPPHGDDDFLPTDPGGGGAQRIDPRVGTPQIVRKNLNDALKRGDCEQFLGRVITQLKSVGLLSSDFSTAKLLGNIADVSTITIDLTGRGRYGHVIEGTDHIQLSEAGLLPQTLTRGRPEYTQDLWSRLLHEGFHLTSNTNKPGAFISDGQLAQALESTKYLIGSRSIAGDSSAIGRTFGFHCGPNAGKY
jgi:RHS repeat-associated protein